jgi:hemolysin activation/secretion protein
MHVFLKRSLCIFLLVCSPFTFAQQSAADAARQAQQQEQREQERQQRDIEQIRQRPDKPSGIDTRELAPQIAPSAPSATCRDIDEIVIEDAPHLTNGMREHIAKQYSKRCLGVNEIEQILGEITRDYLQRGYIAVRAYLPAQDLRTRKLRILVVEGRLGQFIIDDGDKHSVSTRMVFPGLEGRMLNLRDLEQGIEQINRLPSNDATMEIQPGADVGVSDVVVHNQPALPYHGSLSLDNQGTKSTGKNQLGVSGAVDNLLGGDDMLSAIHRESVFGDERGERSRSDTFNISVPYGYFLFSYALSYSTYESTVELPSGLEEISRGTSRNHNALLDYVAYRDQDSRLSFSLGLTNKETKSYFADQFLAVGSRTLTILDLDGNLSTVLGGGLLRANLGYARGLNNLDALDDPSNLPGDAPRAQFEKYKYGLSYNYPFVWRELPWSIGSSVTGQHSLDVLYGSEQLLIGGIYTVRGFEDTTLSGDNGYYWRNDLSVQPHFNVRGESIGSRFYVGVDYGEVSSIAGDMPEGHLSGWGFGGELFWRGFNLEVFNTRAISLPSDLHREGSQTWVRLSYSM